MKFEFAILMTIEANSEAEAKENAEISLQNFKSITGHAPFSVELDLDTETCEQVEDEDDDV